MIHALITVMIADLGRANIAARDFGTGTNFTLLAYGADAPTDETPVGSYCAAHFHEPVLAAVTALISNQFPGATITPYQLDAVPARCPLPAVFAQLGWRLALSPIMPS